MSSAPADLPVHRLARLSALIATFGLLCSTLVAPPASAAPAAAAPPTGAESADDRDGPERPDATAADEVAASNGDVVSLLDGVADLDGGTNGEADGDRQEGATLGRAASGTVHADVTDALAEDDEVAVMIRLADQADLDEVTVAATRAGRQAGADARSRERARGADGPEVAAAAREAAHTARVSTVVQALQATAAQARPPIAALLDDLAAAGSAREVREYWIFAGFAATVDAAGLDRLASHPDVARIELDAVLEVPDVVEGPRLPTWSLEAVNAPDAWGEYGYRGAGVVVGVLDTGVDGGHPALTGTYRGRDGDHARSWYVPTGENYPTPGDGHGHGTHVTGSITGGPPGDVTGVAPDAEWIGIKIFNDGGSTSDSIIADGMQWVLAPGGDPSAAPHVVNNSWGHPDATRITYWDEVEAWHAAGILPVFANGNSGPGAGTVGSPGSYPLSFGVGATDVNDVIAGFSSRGPAFWDGERHLKPQVSAPGHQIHSAWPQHTGQDYRTISGTSMASPHVAGVAALVLSARPDLSVDDLRDILEGTARTASHMGSLPNDSYGHGIVDAYAATTRAALAGTLTGTVSGPDGPLEATIRVADEAATTSDPETGDYELFVREGTHDVAVEAYGFIAGEATVTIVAQEETTADFLLDVADVSTLSGVVVSAGDPVEGATVELVGTPLEPVRTDALGRFAVEVAHGTHDLRVRAHGHLPATRTVRIDGDTAIEITLDRLDQPSAPGWSEYQNNPARTGLTDEDLVPESFDELWSADLGGNVVFSSPVIADGRVFLTTDGGRLHALDAASGDTLWTFATGGTQRSTPAVSGDRVYVAGGTDATLYALGTSDGSVDWTYSTGSELPIYATPTEVDGIVYLSTGLGTGNGGFVHAIDAASGERLWRSEVGPQIFFGPAVADGTVIAASRELNRIVAFDAASGDELWRHDHDETFISMPAIADGVVYTGTSTNDFSSGSVLALDAGTGDVLWHATGHGDSQGNSPVIYGDLVILGSHSHGTVTAYDRQTGDQAWRHVVGTATTSAQLVTSGGVLLGGSQDSRVWALDASTGELRWDTTMTDNVLSAPAAADDMAVFSDRRGRVTAFVTTGTVSGTVTGPDGPLVADVTIAETGASVTTDPDTGRFELVHRPGSYTLEVRAYGYEQHAQGIEVTTGRTTTVEVDLAAVGDGSVAGTVTDEHGDPIAGAEVTLHGTPLAPAVTGADGRYGFAEVAAGTYGVTADADGYAPQEGELTVTAGATTSADFTLVRYDIAVVADYEGMVTAALRADGWLVDRVTFEDIDGTTDRYGAIVVAGMNGDRADADLERFARIVEDADADGTSLVLLDQWALSYGSIRSLSDTTGDPASLTTERSNRGRVWLEDVVDHPITATLDVDARVQLLSGGDHAWFDGYTGQTLARLGTDQDGPVGGGIGYQRRTLTSNHVLLPVHAPTPWSNPTATWQPAMFDLLAGAVDHAVAADYGAVAGTVTDAEDAPLAATVEVVDALDTTRATDDGSYRLLLEPGDHTLRFRALGAETADVDVTIVAGETLDLDVQLADSGLGTLTGQVTDEASGTAIAGATVRVVATDLEATTGGDGRYQIDGIPGGTYDLELEADGYLPTSVEDVEVTDGAVTTLDITMVSAPVVVVVGDRNDEISTFLIEHGIPTTTAGWEVTDDLDGVDVVVLHNPANITDRDQFLTHLDAFDEAGVSVVFPADGWATRTRGIDLLVRHTGNPSSYGRIGGFSGPEIFLHDLADHAIFAGIEDDPAQILTAASEAAYFPDYDGIALADVALEGTPPAGIGVAYDPRTPDSVHVLLSGLASTLRNSPDGNWTDDGRRIFLNTIRWSADPQLARITGTVADPDEDPITHARVEVVGTHWETTTDDVGGFALGVPAGDHTVRISAFGYVTEELTVSVGPAGSVDASVRLEVGDVGTITGTVTSSGGDVDPDAAVPFTTLEGVEVALRGTPLSTVTDEAGRFTLERVETGSHELELETDGHVRTIADVEVTTDQTTRRDVELRVSPSVGIIDDSGFANSRDRGKAFLEDWGYLAEDVGWEDLERIRELDLVVANISSFPNPDPGPDGFAAFLDVVNRGGIPVLWLGQHGRGAIQYLQDYTGDPTDISQGFNDGPVTATVVEDHPLTAGLPDEFPLTEPDRRYSAFDGFGGTTVATLSTGDDGHVGDTIGFAGRTAQTVDVLLSTLTATTWGAPGTRDVPALFYTPEAERAYVNALAWALEADGIGAEVRGHVQDETGARIASTIEVVETGRTFSGREGDGTFVVPLEPGTWTLEISSFAYETATYEVTVAAGEVDRPIITLAAGPAGDIVGTVTAADGGTPIEGVAVRVLHTDRADVTSADGGYRLATIPEGEWTVEARADGYRVQRVDVTVEDGVTHTLDLELRASDPVAVAGDRFTTVADLLTDEGYTVDSFAYNALDQITADIDRYRLVILNGVGTAPSQEVFTTFLDAAAAADVSVIFPSQFGNGSIRHLSPYTGDPESFTQGFRSEEIAYTILASHPVFAGYDVGDTVTILRNPGLNQQFQFFSGYSGTTIARLDAPVVDEQLGDGVAYRYASPQSVHLLLGSMAASLYGSPPDHRWTDDATTIYLNAVDWAIDASQGEVIGTIASDGQPIEGATVTAVEAGASTRSAADGGYRMGLPPGEHTITAAADGYETASRTVTVGDEGAVTADFDLTRLPRGEIEVVVTDASDDAPVAGAEVAIVGPMDQDGVTDADGRLLVDDLVEGDYEVTTTASGYLAESVEVTVVADERAVVRIALAPNDVAVLGDVDSALTDVLRDAGVAVEARSWDELADDLGAYQVVVVNGGEPTEAQFEAVVDAADDAAVSLIFTGTWGVDRGGIRLLEAFTDDVSVGGHGYGDGEIGLTGFDPDHPLFEDLQDPARIVADDGYYSWLDDYVGHHLGDLTVDGQEAGLAVAYDFRGADHVHLLLSMAAVTDVMGPGYGWTADTGQLVANAVAWARDVEQEAPQAPTLTTDADELSTRSTVTLEGEAPFRSTVTIVRDGDTIGTTEPDRDGSYTVEVELVEGQNVLTAVATNHAGSATSAPLTLWLDTTGPVLEWTPDDRAGFLEDTVTVAGVAHDEPAGVATVEVNGVEVAVDADGAWSTEVALEEGANQLTVTATDTLGNRTVEARTVAYLRLATAWELPPNPARAINVQLHVTDADGVPTEVDGAELDAVAQDGSVDGPHRMRWSEDRYQAVLRNLPTGDHDLVARLSVDQWTVTVVGPTVTVR